MKVARALAVLVFVAAVSLDAACNQAGTTVPAATTSTTMAAPAAVLRGEYLVRSVAGCGECHTPRDAQGNLEQGQWLAGVANRFDLTLDDDTTGAISAPNLTPSALASWTDDQVKQAFQVGVGRDGSPLFPLMPYYAYRNMTDADADAIVAYLRAVPAIANSTPPRQTLPVTLTVPAAPIPVTSIPDTTLPQTDRSTPPPSRGATSQVRWASAWTATRRGGWARRSRSTSARPSREGERSRRATRSCPRRRRPSSTPTT